MPLIFNILNISKIWKESSAEKTAILNLQFNF